MSEAKHRGFGAVPDVRLPELLDLRTFLGRAEVHPAGVEEADPTAPFMSVEEARSRFPQDRIRIEVEEQSTTPAHENDDGHSLLD